MFIVNFSAFQRSKCADLDHPALVQSIIQAFASLFIHSHFCSNQWFCQQTVKALIRLHRCRLIWAFDVPICPNTQFMLWPICTFFFNSSWWLWSCQPLLSKPWSWSGSSSWPTLAVCSTNTKEQARTLGYLGVHRNYTHIRICVQAALCKPVIRTFRRSWKLIWYGMYPK